MFSLREIDQRRRKLKQNSISELYMRDYKILLICYNNSQYNIIENNRSIKKQTNNVMVFFFL